MAKASQEHVADDLRGTVTSLTKCGLVSRDFQDKTILVPDPSLAHAMGIREEARGHHRIETLSDQNRKQKTKNKKTKKTCHNGKLDISGNAHQAHAIVVVWVV